MLYGLGRWCRPWLERVGARLSFSPARVSKVVIEYFGRRDRRAIVISKLVHGVGFTGLIAAGSLLSLAWFRRSLALRTDARTYFNLGDAFQKMSNTAEARANFREALRLDPMNEMAAERLRQLEARP